MATVQYLSPGSHTGGHMSNSHQQQPEFTVKEIFLLVASATLDGRGPNRGTQLRRVKPSRIGHVLPNIRKFDLMEARPDRTSALDVIKQHLGQGGEKADSGNDGGAGEEYASPPKLQMGRSPNSVLVSNVNRSGGSLTIEPQKYISSTSPLNQKGTATKSSESANDEDSSAERRIYEDPQVNSIAWANNMVEAMMSDSDEEEFKDEGKDIRRGQSDDDRSNQLTISPTKKRKRQSIEDSSEPDNEDSSSTNIRKKFMPKIALDLPKNFIADLNGSNSGTSLHGTSSRQNLDTQSSSKQSYKAKQLPTDEPDDQDYVVDRTNECAQCGKVFSKARSLQIHMEAIHLRTNFQKCPYCSKECSQVVHMVRHIKCVHYKVRHFQCMHCESASYQKNDVVRHLQSKHKYTGHDIDSQYSEIPQKVILYDCPECSFQSVDCETLLSHAMNEHFDAEQYEASLANSSTTNRSNPTDTPSFGRGTPRNVRNPHLPKVEITPIINKSPLQRNEHSQSKPKLTGPRIVTPQGVPTIVNKDDASDNNEVDKYFCNTCGKGFAKVRSLQIHVEAVHLRTNFQRCPYCSKECSQAGHMVRHIKCVHYKIRHFQCNLCEVASYQKNDAVRHVQSKHKYTGADVESQFHDIPQQVILYDCPKCKFQTTECEALLDHSNKIHGEFTGDEDKNIFDHEKEQQQGRKQNINVVQGYDEDDDDDGEGQYEQQVVNIGEPEVNIVEAEGGGILEVEELSEDESLSEIEEEIDDIEEDEENEDIPSNGIKEIVDEPDDDDEDEVEEEVEEVSE